MIRILLTAAILAVASSPTLSCTITDEGYQDGRIWFDIDGNGADDYCRVVGDHNMPFVSCQYVDKDGSCGKEKSLTLKDMGYPGTRTWADRDGDGYPDFCRQVGNTGSTFIRCAMWNKKIEDFGQEKKY